MSYIPFPDISPEIFRIDFGGFSFALRWYALAYIAGLSAPKGRKMGHAGAIISAFGESAQEKVEILSAAGITIAPNPSAMGETMASVLASRRAAA